MTTWDFADLIGRLEAEAKKQPASFRLSAFWFALLGYLCLGVCFGVLLFCAVTGVYLYITSSFMENPGRFGLGYVCLFLSGVSTFVLLRFIVLWARYRSADASVRLDLSKYPELSRVLDELAHQLRAPKIRQVRIDSTTNASAVYEGALAAIGLGRPVLYLGVPLISFLSFAQLRALIAHELAHFSAGHGRFGWLRRIVYPWTIFHEIIVSPKSLRATILIRGAFFWVTPFIKWYFPRLQARQQVIQRLLDEVLADQNAATVSDPMVSGSTLIQSNVLIWLEVNFTRELDREARRTGVPTYDITQRRLAYLTERLKTFPLEAAVWFVLGEEPTLGATHPVLAERLSKCGLPVDRADPAVREKLTSLLTFSSIQQPPIQVAALLQELDAQVYDQVAEAWATASINVRNFSYQLQHLDKKLATSGLSEDEAWERLQLIGLFGPKARHQQEIRNFHERFPNNINGKILSTTQELYQGNPTGADHIEEWIQQTPEFSNMVVEALEHFYAKRLNFDEAQRQADRRRALLEEQRALEQARALIRPTDTFAPSSLKEEQRSKIATKLARIGLVKRAYLVSKAVDFKDVKSFDILGLKLSDRGIDRHQRQVQLQQLASVLQGTPLTVVFLEKRRKRLEKIFGAIPEAKIEIDRLAAQAEAAISIGPDSGYQIGQSELISNGARNTTPPPLPASLPPPPPAPAAAGETRKSNPGLLILAGITVVSVLVSIVVLAIFVAKQSPRLRPGYTDSEEQMNSEKLISELTAAIQNDPNNPDLFLQRGDALRNAARYQDAIDDYSRVIKLQPANARAYFCRGNLEEYGQQFPQAAADYTQAIRFDPKPVDAYQRRGKLYFKLKKYDEAVGDLTKVIQLQPNAGSMGYWDRAMAYAAAQNHQKAIEDYTAALSFMHLPGLLVERGEEYLKMGDYQKALDDFNETLRLKGESAPARFGLAQCHYQLHDYDRAIAECTAVIKMAPRYAEAYRLRGEAYQQKQLISQANADSETASKLERAHQ